MTAGAANVMRCPTRLRAMGVFFCLGMLLFSFQAHAANPAENFIQETIQKGSAILEDKSLDPGEREREFRDFVLSITDMRRVALFTLGSYAKHAPEDAIAGFVSAFTDLDVALYRNGFNSYAHNIRITGSITRAEDDVIVTAEGLDPTSKLEPMKIAFRVRKAGDGKDIILDVQLDGTWLALSQSQEFASYLRLNGGDIAKLSNELETHIAK